MLYIDTYSVTKRRKMTSIPEDGLIKTGSIEQVVAPLSTHLCHLILLCGSETELGELTRLEAAAKAVAKHPKTWQL